MSISQKMDTLYRMIDKVPMQFEGRELMADEKLGVMYRHFPKVADEIFATPPSRALELIQKQFDLVTLYKRDQLFKELEGKFGGDAA